MIEFWITNITNKDVSLSDLGVTIRAYSSINLLDSKHYYITKEQIEKSIKLGSLFKRKNVISIRKIYPQIEKKYIKIDKDAYIPNRQRSIFENKQETYEELNISDEDFAKDII